MEELVTGGVQLRELFAASLGENQVAGPAVARLDRPLAVRRGVFPVVTPEAAIPILVPDVVGMGAPIHFDFREKIVAVNFLRLGDERSGLRGIRKSFA